MQPSCNSRPHSSGMGFAVHAGWVASVHTDSKGSILCTGSSSESALADQARNLLPLSDLTACGCRVARILRLARAPASDYAAFERVRNPCRAFLDTSRSTAPPISSDTSTHHKPFQMGSRT